MKDMLERLFEAIDGKDATGFVEFLAEDATFRFGSSSTVSGKANIKNSVEGFFASVKSLDHRILSVWEEADILICEGEVTYRRQDGKILTLPFANIFKMKGALISDYRIYIDPTPLFS